jgi:hypothetical protein
MTAVSFSVDAQVVRDLPTAGTLMLRTSRHLSMWTHRFNLELLNVGHSVNGRDAEERGISVVTQDDQRMGWGRRRNTKGRVGYEHVGEQDALDLHGAVVLRDQEPLVQVQLAIFQNDDEQTYILD